MSRIQRAALCAIVLVTALGSGGCFRRTFVVVPHRDGGYGARDTLYGRRDGQNVRVIFRHDTTWRVDTLTRTDTLWRGGTRIIRDTVRVPATPGVPGPPVGGVAPRVPARRDTIYLPDPRRGRDTVYLPRPGTGRVDTVRFVIRDTIYVPRGTSARRDTVRIVERDTVRIATRDTIRLVVRDTVLVGGGRRLVFVPPGQFPPTGQCRLWIFDRPPGQQARAAACDQLGPIPSGAFVLFAGTAWDMDHDWISEARNSPVPPEILALKRRGAP